MRSTAIALRVSGLSEFFGQILIQEKKMITLRKASARGRNQIDWLKSWFTFSFDQYHDPAHTHWSALRVINEDIIAPERGFGMHPHRDMEIISFVIDGALRHEDNLGNVGILRPGEIQRMTAGSGIMHSEFNPDAKIPTHMLQIWIMPSEKNRTPSWEQLSWTNLPIQGNGMRLLASPDGRENSSTIGQDATLWHLSLDVHQSRSITLEPGRKGWLQIAEGKIEINSDKKFKSECGQGDGLAVSGESQFEVLALESASLLWFDLP
jgi:quercetin 2,3-dioxygenase